MKDDRGRPLFLQGVAFDITENKRAQEVLVADAVRKAKIQEELAIARRVQLSILPRSFAVPGLDVVAKATLTRQIAEAVSIPVIR